MAGFESITDRDAFGHWLSGFTDGEGCFYLGFQRNGKRERAPLAQFRIGLRLDDKDILERIKLYWNVGIINVLDNGNQYTATLRVSLIKDLTQVVIPHFHQYPLRAKKARDFAIWEQGVLFMIEAKKRKTGQGRRYIEKDKERFAAIRDALQEQRKPESSRPLSLPVMPIEFSQGVLFD